MKVTRKYILILRPDNIGDCVLFSGTLKYYRELYPNFEITLALKKHIIPLFENCPYIDYLVDFKKYSYVKTNNNFIEKINKRIRKLILPIFNKFKRKWDIIICPVRSITPEMLWIVKNHKANKKIGIVGCPSNFPKDKQYLKKKVFTEFYTLTVDKLWQHELKTNMEFLNYLGANIKNEEEILPEFWTDDNNYIDKFANLSIPPSYCLLFPFASNKIRELSINNFIQIVKKISTDDNILILGTLIDYEKAEILKTKLNSIYKNVVNLCGYTAINDIFPLIKNADKIISIESGPLHIAIALNKPTYAIVGGGHWGRFLPWGDSGNVHWLNKRMSCFQCNWECQYGDFRCVKNIDYNTISNLTKEDIR
ncbi:MAG TPA: glycosyltransferase family 9 protein [Candidatus Marinimicrobia bacterium]|nr:glycosyltransferase family 9 protein [Candidatus Neomarinimicrobiota bacterium]